MLDLRSYYEALVKERIDPFVLHSFWLYLIARDVRSYEEFIDVVMKVMSKVRRRRGRSARLDLPPRANVDSKCFCGFTDYLIHIRNIVSENFGRTIYSLYVCPAYFLTAQLIDYTLIVMADRRVEIEGLTNLYPDNINASLLVKESGSRVRARDVIEALSKVEGRRVVIVSDRYSSALLDDESVDSLLKIIDMMNETVRVYSVPASAQTS